jgi:hypothetical protein
MGMIWSLLGMALMGLSFPKCVLTERKWPEPSAPKVHQPNRSWTHNCKDDFTDDVDGDKEWWLKFMAFWLLVFMVLSVAFGVQLIVL